MLTRHWLERAQKELCALLIPFVVIKSWVIALLLEDFHFSSLLWTKMPVAYFQLMYSWRPIVFPVDNLFSYTAFCSDYTASTLFVWSTVTGNHSAWYQHKDETQNAPQPGERKLLSLVCCGNFFFFTSHQCLRPSVNILPPVPLLCAWCKPPACAVSCWNM